MAKKDNEWMRWHAKKTMMIGVALLIAGLLRYMGYDWSVVLMVLGALAFIKGLMKMKM